MPRLEHTMKQRMGKQKRWLAASLCAVLAGCSYALPPLRAEAADLFVIQQSGCARTVGSVLDEELVRTGEEGTVVAAGRVLAESELAATGQEIQIPGHGTRQIVVMGDVLGTGRPGLTQVTRMVSAYAGEKPLSGAWLAAGDYNGSGAIDLSDIAQCIANLDTAGERTVRITTRDVTLYVKDPSNAKKVRASFIDGSDVPYIATSDLFDLLHTLYEPEGLDIPVTRSRDGIVTLVRSNGTGVVINFNTGTATCSDFDGFFQPPYATTAPDLLLTAAKGENGAVRYIERADGSFERRGPSVTVDLDRYGIPIVWQDGTGYIPAATVSDLFLAPIGTSIVYNGQMAGVIKAGHLGALEDVFYDAAPRRRSQSLADFTYRELCMVLDTYYGLRKEHNISDFNTLFTQTGLDTALQSLNSAQEGAALTTLTEGYLGDIVSKVLSPSSYAGKDANFRPEVLSPSQAAYRNEAARWRTAADEAYPDGIPPYEEIGNTAYVTLTDFETHDHPDYYSIGLPEDAPTDVLGLIAYAHSRITRPGSPIRNVVVDISAATGDDMTGAIYTIGWLAGTGCVNVNDTLTGSQSSTRYSSDVNLDGRVDMADSIQDRRRFLLISPVTGAAGNVAAASLAQSDVRLVGQTTSGGACDVMPIALADGTVLLISGNLRVSALENGSYYDVNKGVVPQFRLAHPWNFYDRDTLSVYLDALY